MAGKAPLLLASVLFIVGAVGLALTSAERAEWGPFEPHALAAPEQRVVIFAADVPFVDPIPLEGLLAVPAPEPVLEKPAAPALVLAEAEPDPEAEAAGAAALVPLRVFGLSSDTGGVAAATATPPLRVVNVAADDSAPEEADDQPLPAAETPEPSDEATREPSEPESPAAEATPEPEAEDAPAD